MKILKNRKGMDTVAAGEIKKKKFIMIFFFCIFTIFIWDISIIYRYILSYHTTSLYKNQETAEKSETSSTDEASKNEEVPPREKALLAENEKLLEDVHTLQVSIQVTSADL